MGLGHNGTGAKRKWDKVCRSEDLSCVYQIHSVPNLVCDPDIKPYTLDLNLGLGAMGLVHNRSRTQWDLDTTCRSEDLSYVYQAHCVPMLVCDPDPRP